MPLVIATMLREEGITGVHTHVRQLRRYLEDCGTAYALVTPFSWGRTLTYPVFGFRRALELCSKSAGVVWYRHWHEAFLRNALRRRLAEAGDCVVYAQGPLDARAALRARRGPHQRVVMAVHLRISQADEWADKKQIRRDGTVFRAIRQVEREVIPQVDGLVYVSRWARDALLSWLPEAAAVPSAVIGNFVAPCSPNRARSRSGTWSPSVTLILSRTTVSCWRFWLRPGGPEDPLPWISSARDRCRKDLLRQARSLGLEEQVRFRGFRPDVRDFLPGYRAYVHASYSESSSLAIIEAMAAAFPSWQAISGRSPSSATTASRPGSGSLDDPAQAADTADRPARLASRTAEGSPSGTRAVPP